jgi:hypothetical protein
LVFDFDLILRLVLLSGMNFPTLLEKLPMETQEMWQMIPIIVTLKI